MSIGRISNRQLSSKLMSNIQGQLETQERLFEQISTSKRLLRPSDDPNAVSKSMYMNSQLRRYDEYEQSISSAEVWSNVTAVSLDNAVSVWRRVNELGISAADGTKTAEDRAGMAEELEQLLSQLVQTGNSTHAGRYIFGGSKTGNPPFASEVDPNTGRITKVYYQGDSTVREIKSSDHGTTAINTLGSNAGSPDSKGAFIDSNQNVDLFQTVIDLRDKLLDNDIVGISGSGGILEAVDRAQSALTGAEVRNGGTQEILLLDKNRIIEQSASVEQHLSEIEDADIAQLILELNNVQNVYEAALAAGGRILQTGLINYI